MATISEALAIALEHHRAGRFPLAEQIYRQILEAVPNHADALHLLGVVAYRTGRHGEAVEWIQRAIALSPGVAAYHNNLGNAFQEQGRLPEAEACYQRALGLNPDYAQAHYNLGNTVQTQGRLAEAIACYRRALRLKPDYVDAHSDLGNALHEEGHTGEAIACFERALSLNVNCAKAHNGLGTALQSQGQMAEAIVSFERAVALKPDFAAAHNNLGNVLQKQGRLDEAVACYQRALQWQPDYVDAHSNLGRALKSLGKHAEAIACHQRAIELKPDRAEAYSDLSYALQEQGRLTEAIACCQRAMQLKPDFAEVYNSLGGALANQGRVADAIASYERALELDPGHLLVSSNLLLTLHYREGIRLNELAEAHAAWQRRHGAPLEAGWKPHGNTPDPDRPLRLGFVSPDFARHPIGFFLIRVLESLDRAECETVCYSDREVKDDFTARFRASATRWRDVVGWSDERLDEQVRIDRIDLLFDLAGHTAYNRLLVFARKPAPIQLTWAGYMGTTGLAAMDYILADRWQISPEAEAHYCEKVLRMPDGYVSYDPPSYAAPVAPLPALAQGHVTFGSLNNPAKINRSVVKAWAEILRRVPGSRMVLKYRGLDDSRTRSGFEEAFSEQGVSPDRFEFSGIAPHPHLLEQYSRIDLALDPFPYSGGLTTCEALWMGVPVVTCPGETFASRHSLGHLSNVGLTETIAKDLSEYVELAVRVANNLPQLAKWRAELRERMAHSPLCDGPRFAANFTKMLRSIWRPWCESHRGIAEESSAASFSETLAIAQEHHQAGRFQEAEKVYRSVLQRKPDCAEAHHGLGITLQQQDRHAEAIACYERALDLNPNFAASCNNLGSALQRQGRLAEAIACYQRTVELKPDYAFAHYNLGNALEKQGQITGVIACYRRAIELKPDYSEAHNNLGNALREQGELTEAAACFQRALELDPTDAEAHNNLGNVLRDQGRLAEAIASYQRAMELVSDSAGVHNNLLLAIHSREGIRLADLAEAHAEYQRRHAASFQASWKPHENVRNPERPLRLGFVSPDLYRHPVGYFLVRVLENLDRAQSETVCYSDRQIKDDMTTRLQAAAARWHDATNWSDDRLAEQIRADRIDLLFDLAGHTGYNRLLVFARKPAPIQLTWAGYVGTTGLAAMDYIVADRWEIPPEAESYYCEKVLRMPDGYLCYDPPSYAPPVMPLPALTQGHVTFGSFNNVAKVNPSVVKIWSMILRRVPGSRLLLKYRGYEDGGTRRLFERMFAACGVSPDQIDLLGGSPHPQFLAHYHQIDLALDPFPYSGGLTTCEAMWMGVPVVTCPGETFASRHALSHLSNVGLTETVAKDPSEYVELAVRLANGLPGLAKWRMELRQRMARSPLCDGPRFAANLAQLLRGVWREWCR